MSMQCDVVLQEWDVFYVYWYVLLFVVESVLCDEVYVLYEVLVVCDEWFVLYMSCCEVVEQWIVVEQVSVCVMCVWFDDLMVMVKMLCVEVSVFEQVVQVLMDDLVEYVVYLLLILWGMCVVYVGGWFGLNCVIWWIVEIVGGEVMLYDGGIEDCKGLLVVVLLGVWMVVFLVDCIDYDLMNLFKCICEWYYIVYYLLWIVSVVSFVELIGWFDVQVCDVIMLNVVVSDMLLCFCLWYGQVGVYVSVMYFLVLYYFCECGDFVCVSCVCVCFDFVIKMDDFFVDWCQYVVVVVLFVMFGYCCW